MVTETDKAFGLADRPIFVGGLFKSGTSLARVLLGQHPRLFASYETYWFESEVSKNWSDPTSKRMSYMLEFYGIDDMLYEEFKAQKRREPYREFIDIVMCHAAARAGKPRWVEKTPGNITHVERILATWSSARIVLCTREFKDTFASWKTRRGNNIDEFIEAVRMSYAPVLNDIGCDRASHLEVDYADLVGDTERTMRRVIAFVGEEWDICCANINLERTAAERRCVEDVTGRDNLTSISLAKPIFQSSVGQWRTMLTADEAATIERELSDLYDRLGDRWVTS